MRVAYFDNLKGLLIYLVVAGHLIGQFLGINKWIDASYFFIFLFHMPLFVFASGYFSKGFQREGYLKGLAWKLLIPYVLFQGLYTGYYNLFEDGLSYNYLIPRWALWFLLSLFCWNLLLHVFVRLKGSLIWSIVIGVCAGYLTLGEEMLSLSRTFFFFPFFLLGHYATEKQVFFFQKKHWKVISVVALVVLFGVVYHYDFVSYKQWLMGKRSYDSLLGETTSVPYLWKLLVYGVMTVVSVMILTLVPKQKTIFTAIGKNTMYVYMLHLFFVEAIVETAEKWNWTEEVFPFLFLFAAGIVWITQTPWMKTITRLLIECPVPTKKTSS